MKLKTADRPVGSRLRAHHGVFEPFCFVPLVVDALKDADVSCPFCSVKMISRTGLIGGLCPCFEERCAKCGDEILLEDGALARGLTVGRGGSWRCEKCASSRPRRRAIKRSR